MKGLQIFSVLSVSLFQFMGTKTKIRDCMEGECFSFSLWKQKRKRGRVFSFECFKEGVFTLEGECGGKSLFINIWEWIWATKKKLYPLQISSCKCHFL